MAILKKLKNNSLMKWGVIALILIIAILAWKALKPKETQPNYITAKAVMGDIEENVMASGKVKALNRVDVGSQVTGEVKKLYVQVGDHVKKGDIIAQIDQVTQKNNLSNQQASLQQSQADLASAKADVISRQAGIESAKAELLSRQADLKQAQADFARLQSLLAINAISQQEYDAAATKVDNAKANVAMAKANIETAKAAFITAQSRVTNEQAALQKAQTNVNTAQKDLSYTTIIAPIDGTVVSVTTEQGSTVNANQAAPTIVTLADLSTVRINAQISEADVINVKAGMPVYFNIIGNPDKKFDSVLKAIEPAPEKISNTSSTDSAVYYIGYLEVPNPEQKFRIDMTAQVYIIINQAKNTLLVPSAAIHKQGGQDSVKIIKPDGTVEEKNVKVGINNRIQAQVLEGLAAGDEVILSEEPKDEQNKQPDF